MDTTGVFNLQAVTLMLIEAGADMSYRYPQHENNTLLHLAIANNNVPFIKLLLQSNPNLNARNNKGETVEDLAVRLNYLTIVHLLDDFKNQTFETIDERFVYELTESFSSKSIEDLKNNRNFKILRVKECKNTKALLDKIQKDAYRKAFSKTSHLFVIIIETNEKLKDDLNFPISIFNDPRPLVIQFVEETQKSTIYYKELNSSEFTRINESSELSRKEFLKKFSSEEGCNFPTLIHGINSMTQGNFSNVLTDIKLIKGDYIKEIATIAAKFNVLCLLVLKLFKTDLGVEISSLYETFEYNARQSLITLLELPFSADEGKSENEILMAIIKRKDVSLLQTVLKNGFEVGKKENPLKSALALKYYDCAKELIEADSCFPKKFDPKKIDKNEPVAIKLQDILNTRTDFHNEIKSGNIERVKTFIDNNSRLKHGYDASNTSALRVALEAKQWEIYTMLQSRGFSAGVDKKLDRTLYDLDIEHKESIREINKRFFKTSESSHLFHALTKTRLSFNYGNNEEFFEVIRSMYERLNEMPTVKPILKLLEKWEVFQIIIDFAKRFVADMDPTVPNNTQGVAYPNGYIYVAAANHTEERDNIIGTLAHELTHFANTLVYGNNKKPYESNDEACKSKFEDITRNMETYWESHKKETSWIISAVFKNYSKDQWHSELIVRVPHLSAVCADEELLKIKEIYCNELFEFYNKTLNDIALKIDFLQPEADIEELNKTIGQMKKIEKVYDQYTSNEEMIKLHHELTTIPENFRFRIISSNVPQLTLTLIYDVLFKKYEARLGTKVIFASIESLSDEYLTEKIRNSCNSKADPQLIVKVSDLSDDTNKLLSDIQSFSSNGKLLMIAAHENFGSKSEEIVGKFPAEHLRITHLWTDLAEYSQEQLLLKEVNFHGSPVKLQDILPSNVIGDFPLQHIMTDRLMIDNITQKEIFSFKQGVYIERKFTVQQRLTTETVEVEMNQDELIEDAKAKRVMIISDAAGMGKTTTLKEIAKALKVKYPACWISFIDLKQHIDKFEVIAKSTQKTQNFTEVILMCIEKDFDKKVFLSLYQAGKVFLLLDGFDEISPRFKDLIIEAAASFNTASGNQLWITTRTHMKTDLERGLNKLTCSLVPLTRDDQVDIVLDYWKLKGKLSNRQLNLKELATNLIEKLSSKLSKSGSDLIKIPLQIRIIAEIYVDRADEVQKLQTLSFYSIYETLMRKNIGIWMREKGESSLKDRIEMHMNSLTPVMKVHQQIALNYRFGSDFANLQIEKEEWDREMIARVGIIHYDITQKTHFIHETFAEFFIAHFIINNLKLNKLNVDVKMMTKLLQSVLTVQEYQMIRIFLDSALEIQNNQSACNQMISTAPLNVNIEDTRPVDTVLKTVAEGLENLFMLVFACIESFNNATLKQEILTCKTEKKQNILMLAGSVSETESMLKIVWEKATGVLEPTDLLKLINEKDTKGSNVLHLIIKLNGKALQRMISILRNVFIKTEDLKVFLNENEGDSQRNVLCLAASHFSKEFFVSFWTFLHDVFDSIELKTLLFKRSDYKQNAMHIASESNSKEVVRALFESIKGILELEELKDFVQQKADDFNILFIASSNKKNEGIYATLLNIFKDLSMKREFKAMLFSKDGYGVNVLYHIIMNADINNYYGGDKLLNEFVSMLKEVFSNIELKMYLREKIGQDEFGDSGFFDYDSNVLCQTALTLKKDKFEYFWKFLQEVFDTAELKVLLLETDDEGKTALHNAVWRNNGENIESLFKIIKDLLNSEERRDYVQLCDGTGLTILDYAAIGGGENIITKLWNFFEELSLQVEFKAMLQRKNSQDRNMLQMIIFRSEHMLEELLTVSRKIFTNEELKIYLNGKGENIVHLISISLSKKIFDWFWTCLEEVFNPTELKELFLETDGDKMNALNLALYHNLNDISDSLFEIIQKYISNVDDQKIYIQQTNNEGNNVLHHASGIKSLKILWKKFQDLSIEDAYKSMLQQKNNKGANVLHSLIIRGRGHELPELKVFLQDIFTKEELKYFFSEKEGEGGKNILFLVIDRISEEDFDLLWIVLEDIFDKSELKALFLDMDTDGSNCLSLVFTRSSAETINILFHTLQMLLDVEEQKNFILKSDSNEKNILYFAAKYFFEQNFRTFWNCFKRLSMENDLKRMLRQRNSEGENVLHMVITESKGVDFPELVTILQEVFVNADELKGYIKEKENKLGRNIVAIFAACCRHWYFNRFWKSLQTIFGFNELKAFLLEADEDGMNVLHLSSRFNDGDMFRYFFNIILSTDIEDKEDFFKMCNHNNDNILHLAARNHEHENYTDKNIFKTVWSCLKEVSMEHLFLSMLHQENSYRENVLQALIASNNKTEFEVVTNILKEKHWPAS